MSEGSDPRSSVFFGKTDVEGFVEIGGLEAGGYFANVVAGDGLMPMSGLRGMLVAPTEVPHEIVVGRFYAAIINVVGDKVAGYNFMYPSSPMPVGLIDHFRVSILESFAGGGEGQIVLTGVPSLKIQREGGYRASLVVCGEQSGWSYHEVMFQPLDIVETTQIDLQGAGGRGGVSFAGRVKCDIDTLGGNGLTGDLIGIIRKDREALRRLQFMLPASGEVVDVPIGDYQVVGLNPWLDLMGMESIYVQGGGEVSVPVAAKCALGAVRPVVSVDGEQALVFGIEVIDPVTGIEMSRVAIRSGTEFLLPAGRELEVTVGVPGWGRKKQSVRPIAGELVEARVSIRSDS